MAPALGCLGRLTEKPGGEKLIEVSGKVKYTGMQIAATSLQPGKISVYDNKGNYTIAVQSKSLKKFKLNNNIKQVTTRNDNLTLVLHDGYQVITKECPPNDVQDLERYIQSIKNGTISKAKSRTNPKPSSHASNELSFHEEVKENFDVKERKIPMAASKNSSPSLRQDRSLCSNNPKSNESPSSSPIMRRRKSTIRGRILDSPRQEKNFQIVESRVTVDNASNNRPSSLLVNRSPWSRPPGEERSHSPSLLNGCRSSSPSLVSSPSPSRIKKTGSKKRLLDVSPLKQINSLEVTDENILASKLDGNVNNENCSDINSFYGASLSGNKKHSNRKVLSDASPLQPKMLQLDFNTSTPRPTKGEETMHKANKFYGSSSSSSIYSPSLLGRTKKKFDTGYFKSTNASRKLSLHNRFKDKNAAYTFSPTEKEVNKSPMNQIALTGFANLGNTCYMNAILQCILGIPTFAQDLDNPRLIGNSTYNSLYRCLYNLLVAKRSKESQDKQRFLLRNIKKAISNQAERFSGYMQHDAHEFLGQCLDQLKEDAMKIISAKKDATPEGESDTTMKDETETTCPVSKNFECGILHTIECTNCGEKITREEIFHDFSLDIPEIDENTSPEDKDLQELLQSYFQNESVGYKCEECGCGDACLSHHFSRLPRVIILHLKRYDFDADVTRYKKKLDTVDVPIELDLGILCTEKTSNPLSFKKVVNSGFKRTFPKESFNKDSDFQPSLKARRKLCLREEPKLTDPENSGAFDKDIFDAKKQSLEDINLDTLTEDQQLEWALMESMKNDSVNHSSYLKNDELVDLPPALLDMNPFEDGNKASKGECYTGWNGSDDTKLEAEKEANFTDVRTKSQKHNVERTEVDSTKKHDPTVVEKGDTELKEDKNSTVDTIWLSEDEKEKIDNQLFLEDIPTLEDEENQLKMALEMSLQEYDELSISRKTKEEKKRKLEVNKRQKILPKSQQDQIVTDVAPKKYRLIGIVSHIGDRSNMGHYISDVFDCKEKEWKSYNDTAVKKITEYEVRYGRKHCAYIFFYINEESFAVINQK